MTIPDKDSNFDEEKLVREKLKAIVDSLPNAKSYSLAFDNVFNQVVEHSIAFEKSMHDFNTNSANDFLDIETQKNWIRNVYTKTSKLLFIELFLDASGLGYYKDQISKNLIDLYFAPKHQNQSENKTERSGR